MKCLMPESTIRVLRDDCSCTENLVGSWVRKFALERGASFFFVDEALLEEENNPCVSSLSQKFSFSVLLSSDGGKIFYSITCIIFGVDDENKVDQSLIFFFLPAFLQGRMTSWDWSLRRRYWKLFNWSFHGWRRSGRRCISRILIVE